uniref:Uncharacterized protein n=1 Tax=Hanusia phi TaxID=3032 RepID=A0A7S0EB78_9CRYP
MGPQGTGQTPGHMAWGGFILVVACCIFLAACRHTPSATSLEAPWSPNTEVVQKPGLSLRNIRQLHDQWQQARWASRFVPSHMGGEGAVAAIGGGGGGGGEPPLRQLQPKFALLKRLRLEDEGPAGPSMGVRERFASRGRTPPAPRWVRDDMDEHSRPADCGGSCVPQSVVAPFNPLSQYERLTSDYDLRHPPGWVRKDFDKRPPPAHFPPPSRPPEGHGAVRRPRRKAEGASDRLAEKSKHEDEEQDKKAEEDLKELEEMASEQDRNRKREETERREVLKNVMEPRSKSKDAALMRILARIGKEQSETLKLNNAFRQELNKVNPSRAREGYVHGDSKPRSAGDGEDKGAQGKSAFEKIFDSEMQEDREEEEKDRALSLELEHLMERVKSPPPLSNEPSPPASTGGSSNKEDHKEQVYQDLIRELEKKLDV